MTVVGLTGSSGSGKGYVAELMLKKGIVSLDTDAVCHNLYKKGEECNLELQRRIGGDITDENGDIDRVKLSAITFGNSDKYRLLNEIAHKHIKKKTLEWLGEKKNEGCDVVIIDAPLLFESGFDALCDLTVCVTTDKETQIKRIIERDSISVEKAETRLSKQKPPMWYSLQSDFVIDNSDGNKDNVKAQVSDLADMLIEIGKNKLHIKGRKRK